MTEKANGRRLIEAGFPCHQVGAETQRERDTGKAPPTHRLHVWWARRPLTPSRAAVLGSILPADTDPDWFLKELGIEKKVLHLVGGDWVLVGKNKELIRSDENGDEILIFDTVAKAAFEKENERRAECRKTIESLKKSDPDLAKDPVLLRWEKETQPLKLPPHNAILEVSTIAADPAHVKDRIDFAKSSLVTKILHHEIRWDSEDLYGYNRAFTNPPKTSFKDVTVMDITAGGGSIPFEALRLGCRTLANELNPVASVILEATLNYPATFGKPLIQDIQTWGEKLLESVARKMDPVTPFSPLPPEEILALEAHCRHCSSVVKDFNGPEYDQTGILYTRQVTCPHCGGEAPLLNTCWLSKGDGDPWGVAIIKDGKQKNGTVRFKTYRVTKGKGPNGEDPDFSTVSGGKGLCVHCGQGIDPEEIKRQARGESEHGRWKDRLYAVAAVRYQPKLDKNGHIQRYKTGEKAGEIQTEKIRFLRPPNERDLAALEEAERMLKENWTRWEDAGLIPTEAIPEGHKTREPLRVGMTRWCDLFTPRQLLGHLFLVEELNRLKPEILKELGAERGKAVVTYLQFAIDKGLDYNSRTGAQSAVALKHLAKEGPLAVGLFGAGAQGHSQALALAAGLPLKELKIYDIRPEAARSLAEKMESLLPGRVRAVSTPAEAADSDAVVSVTHSRDKFLKLEGIRPGTTVCALGSYTECSDDLILGVDRIVVDHVEQCLHRGALKEVVERGSLSEDDISATLGEVVAGLKPGRTSQEERILCVPIGTGCMDVAVAGLAYKKALVSGKGTPFAFD